MTYVMTNKKIVINVDNDVDRDKMMGMGFAVLTDKEIADAGITGYEKYVSPANTAINKGGVITFTPPAPKGPPRQQKKPI